MIEVPIPYIFLKVKLRGQPFMVKSLIAALERLQSLRDELRHRLECLERSGHSIAIMAALGVDLFWGASATGSKASTCI